MSGSIMGGVGILRKPTNFKLGCDDNSNFSTVSSAYNSPIDNPMVYQSGIMWQLNYNTVFQGYKAGFTYNVENIAGITMFNQGNYSSLDTLQGTPKTGVIGSDASNGNRAVDVYQLKNIMYGFGVVVKSGDGTTPVASGQIIAITKPTAQMVNENKYTYYAFAVGATIPNTMLALPMQIIMTEAEGLVPNFTYVAGATACLIRTL